MKRPVNSYGFYTSKSNSSQIVPRKIDKTTIYPGTGISGDKNVSIRKVIKTSGGF